MHKSITSIIVVYALLPQFTIAKTLPDCMLEPTQAGEFVVVSGMYQPPKDSGINYQFLMSATRKLSGDGITWQGDPKSVELISQRGQLAFSLAFEKYAAHPAMQSDVRYSAMALPHAVMLEGFAGKLWQVAELSYSGGGEQPADYPQDMSFSPVATVVAQAALAAPFPAVRVVLGEATEGEVALTWQPQDTAAMNQVLQQHIMILANAASQQQCRLLDTPIMTPRPRIDVLDQ